MDNFFCCVIIPETHLSLESLQPALIATLPRLQRKALVPSILTCEAASDVHQDGSGPDGSVGSSPPEVTRRQGFVALQDSNPALGNRTAPLQWGGEGPE